MKQMNVSVNCGISLVIVNQKSDSQHEDLLDLLVQESCSRLGGGGGGGFRHTNTVRLIVPRRFMLLQPAADSVQLSHVTHLWLSNLQNSAHS